MNKISQNMSGSSLKKAAEAAITNNNEMTSGGESQTSASTGKKGAFEACFAHGLDLSELIAAGGGGGGSGTDHGGVAGGGVARSPTPIGYPEQLKALPPISASQQLLRLKQVEVQQREQEENDERLLQNAVMEQVACRHLQQLQQQMQSSAVNGMGLGGNGPTTHSENPNQASNDMSAPAPRRLDAPLSSILGAMHTMDESGAKREPTKKERENNNDSNTREHPTIGTGKDQIPSSIRVKMNSMTKSRYSNSYSSMGKIGLKRKTGRNEAALSAGFTKTKFDPGTHDRRSRSSHSSSSGSKKLKAVKSAAKRTKY
jgi:hypothetical protein